MSSLRASRWANPPTNGEDKAIESPDGSLNNSRWAATAAKQQESPMADASESSASRWADLTGPDNSGLKTSRWADTPSPSPIDTKRTPEALNSSGWADPPSPTPALPKSTPPAKSNVPIEIVSPSPSRWQDLTMPSKKVSRWADSPSPSPIEEPDNAKEALSGVAQTSEVLQESIFINGERAAEKESGEVEESRSSLTASSWAPTPVKAQIERQAELEQPGVSEKQESQEEEKVEPSALASAESEVSENLESDEKVESARSSAELEASTEDVSKGAMDAAEPKLSEVEAEADCDDTLLPAEGVVEHNELPEVQDELTEKQDELLEEQNAAEKAQKEDEPAQPVLEPPVPEAVDANHSENKANGEAKFPADFESNLPLPSPTKLRLEPPRLRKKISWRGKTCVISIPRIDYDALGLVKPMSPAQVQARIVQFEEAGYDTRGFDLPIAPDGTDGFVHARPIYPDEPYKAISVSKEKPNVKLPDLQTWAEYTSWLVEQKLAALGVSNAPEEPILEAAQELSRQSSTQYPPLPFSPPISSASAASLGRPGLTRGHSATMSVASPISPMNAPFGHMHRHSTFTGAPLSFGHAQQPSQSPSLLGLRAFSPAGQASSQQQTPIPGLQSFSPLVSNQFAIPGFERAMSPPQVAALRNILGAARGPGSPLSQQVLAQDAEKAYDEEIAQRQFAYPPLPQNFSIQGSMQATPMLPQLPEEDDEDELAQEPEPQQETEQEEEVTGRTERPAYVPPHKRAQFNANISAPTPRGHRHNISEGLERDVMEAEERQGSEKREHDHVSPVEENGDSESMAESVKKVKVEEKDPLGQDITVHETAHSRKKSSARLNVAAPAFSFNPSATFQPGSMSFNFGPSPSKPTTEAAPSSTFFGHNRQKSSGNFNAAAPSFQPSGAFQLSSFRPAGISVRQTSDLDFSAKGKPTVAPSIPTSDFNFTAPAPVRVNKTAAEQQDSSSSAEPTEIFGKFKLPDIIKPAKKSKAIAIVKPEEVSASAPESATEFEDSEGRIAQAEDRMKRQRKGGDPGNEVPRFAEPTALPPPPTILGSTSTPELVPAVLSQVNEVDAQPFDKLAADSVESIAGVPSTTTQSPPKTTNVFTPHQHKSSGSLSALAKPFKMPGMATDQTQPIVHEPKQSFATISEIEPLEAKEDQDRENLEPPEIWHTGLTPTPPVIPKFPFQIQPSPRMSGLVTAEPSFDEIDAVMRQLNETEGQSGVEAPNPLERAISPLPLPSPTISGLDGPKYMPQWPRSDAPSPSLGRHSHLFAQAGGSPFAHPARALSADPRVSGWPPVNRLNKAPEAPTSDWSDVLSPPDEAKFQQRSAFFDNHVENVIGRAIEKRLLPLEETLRGIHTSVKPLASSASLNVLRQKRSSSNIDSDADDEDDLSSEQQRQRPISRGKDKRYDQIKAVVVDALREQSQAPAVQPADGFEQVHATLAELKASMLAQVQRPSSPPRVDMSGVQSLLSEMKASLAPKEIPAQVQVPAEIQEIRSMLVEMQTNLAEKQPAPAPATADRLEQLHTALADMKLAFANREAPEPSETLNAAVQELRDMFSEVKQSLAAQKSATPAPAELPELQSILAELKTSLEHSQTALPKQIDDMQELQSMLIDIKSFVAQSQSPSPSPSAELQELRAILSELKSTLGQQQAKEPQASELQEVHSILSDMKVSFARAAGASLELDDVRAVVEDVLSKQAKASPPLVASEDNKEQRAIPEHEFSELQVRFDETLANALEEANLRRQAEERETESRRLLRLAEEELQLLRTSNEDDTSRIRATQSERDELITRLEQAEAARIEKEEQLHDLREQLQTHIEEDVALRTGKDGQIQNLLTRIDDSELAQREKVQQLDELTELMREREEAAASSSRAKDEQIRELAHRLQEVEGAALSSQQDKDGQIRDLQDQHAATYATLEEYRGREEDHISSHREKDQKIQDLQDEHQATYATLEEYRASSKKWRQSLDDATREREDLENIVGALQRQLEEGRDSSESMRKRLEKLHGDLSHAAGQFTSEKGIWREQEDKYRARCEALELQKSTSEKKQTELQDELRVLRAGAAEANDAHMVLDHMKTSNASLGDMVRKLQTDLAERQSLASSFERESHDARESARIEVQRTRMSMQTDIEAANHQVNIVRAELESELSKVRCELENMKMAAELTKTRYERLLEEEDISRRDTLRKLNQTSTEALDDARRKHDEALKETRAAHARVLKHAREDKERSEYILNERLSLADSKLQHYQDKVLHLEERLEITKSAAQAAAINAQTRSGAISLGRGSSIPEKISPQALRESILVLQEQLQEREARIEKLQDKVDNVAPARLRAREEEIVWLRELLSVRNDELTGLINSLSQPTFDRDTVRDIAIRIRANLQMEQQEKERSGNPANFTPGQAIASLSNFASPRAASLSSAFNKWRTSMESSALKNSQGVPRTEPRRLASSSRPSNTPSKAGQVSAMPLGFMSGLMTPPASNLRSSPSPEASSMTLPVPHVRPQSGTTAGPSATRTRKPSDAPTTPLFRPQSYDRDAEEDSKIELSALEDDDDLDNVADSQPPAFRSLEDELGGDSGADGDDSNDSA